MKRNRYVSQSWLRIYPFALLDFFPGCDTYGIEIWSRASEGLRCLQVFSASYTIRSPHQNSTICEESVIIFRRFQMYYDNIVSILHGIAQN